MALVLLNLSGGDCVEDLRGREGDEGFARVLKRVETHGLARSERRAVARRAAPLSALTLGGVSVLGGFS
jgi:hypothetical protein